MRVVIVVLLGLCCLGVVSAALSAEDENWLMLKKYTGNNVVTSVQGLEDFQKHVVRLPRNYTLLIEFLGRSKCLLCPEFDASFTEIASSYKKLKSEPNFHDVIRTNKTAPPPQPLFFLRVYIDEYDHWGFVQKFQLTHIPALVKVGGMKKAFPVNKQYPMNDRSDVNVDVLRDWIHLQTRAFIPLWGDVLRAAVALAPQTIAVILALTALVNIRFVLGLRKNKWFWFLPVLAVYWVTNSGLIGNMINDPPPFQYLFRSDTYVWIYPNLMMQFLYEGYAASTILLLSSLSFVSLLHFPRVINNPIWKRISALSFLAIAVFGLNLWMEMYCTKNPGYPFRFYKPVMHYFITLEQMQQH